MGVKICRPKMMACIDCRHCNQPSMRTDYADAPESKFCFEETCPKNIQRVMVRGSAIIAKVPEDKQN